MVETPCLCAVFEYCPRGKLFEFLMFTGRLGKTATRTYSHQLLNGLNAMHRSGYVPRDLKPENLLLDYDFTLKVCIIYVFFLDSPCHSSIVLYDSFVGLEWSHLSIEY